MLNKYGMVNWSLINIADMHKTEQSAKNKTALL